MLQQTQVARVVPRYEAWMARWPTARALAAAPLPDVLAAWIGLGYNRRARALWEAARVVAERGWPEDLRELPGVGPYTAAAVGSFAFGHRVLALDTNARRVYGRWGLTPDPEEATPELNQAAMELGARICRARAADCAACPISGCAARGRPVTAPRSRGDGGRERFEDSDRYARGRVLAALAGREPWPDSLAPERIERAVEGLVRDGLAIRDIGHVRLAEGTALTPRLC